MRSWLEPSGGRFHRVRKARYCRVAAGRLAQAVPHDCLP
jgi:hypothetical protein